MRHLGMEELHQCMHKKAVLLQTEQPTLRSSTNRSFASCTSSRRPSAAAARLAAAASCCRRAVISVQQVTVGRVGVGRGQGGQSSAVRK
jgi:hypothetical protein